MHDEKTPNTGKRRICFAFVCFSFRFGVIVIKIFPLRMEIEKSAKGISFSGKINSDKVKNAHRKDCAQSLEALHSFALCWNRAFRKGEGKRQPLLPVKMCGLSFFFIPLTAIQRLLDCALVPYYVPSLIAATPSSLADVVAGLATKCTPQEGTPSLPSYTCLRTILVTKCDFVFIFFFAEKTRKQ